MPHERFYYPGPLKKGDPVKLEGQEMRHLAQVMRKKKGDQVEVVNGKGVLAEGVVDEIGKRETSLKIVEATEAAADTGLFFLAQAIPKMNRLELIIEKGTELGAGAFFLFPGERSEKTGISPNQMERLEHIAISAMKQCGRLYLPEIHVLRSVNELEGELLFGDLREGASRFWDALSTRPKSAVTFCVGPESGFTESEIERLEEMGASGVGLHKNILRTETAAIMGMALAAHYFQG